jgi:hypothetical protein
MTELTGTTLYEKLFAYLSETNPESLMQNKDGSQSIFGTGVKGTKYNNGKIRFWDIVRYENYKELTWMEVADLAEKLVGK